jgi:RHS repeat-associated protein
MQDYINMPAVAMVPLDLIVTPIAFGSNSPIQVHQGSVQTDTAGARKAMLIFMPGTSASLVMSNGTTQSVSSLHVRATEFTVGTNGPAAMPGVLPPLSAYTFCVEYSADEAISAGADSVVFDQPVISYVENFLSFPVGLSVPIGFYNRRSAAWEPLPNGRVVKIISITGGLADVDTDGDGVADNGLDIATQERQILASSFTPGQMLWRAPLSHFSPEDENWPYTIPDDATSPAQNGAGPNADQSLQDPCVSNGSVIECENQVLGESVPIVGAPFTLNYRSDRMPGQPAERTINLSGSSVPASLASIGLHLSVAGQNFDQTFPASPNQQTTFVWNRLDAYGRPMIGGQTLSGTIDYNYPTSYQDPGPLPTAFNQAGAGVTLGANPSRQQVNISESFTTTIGEGLTDARTIGLGGWTLSVHQVFDPVARVMHGGNGSRRRAGSLARILTTTTLPGQSILFDVTVGPDGSQYVALPHGDQIVRIAPNGTQSFVAGNGTEGFNGDGIFATNAMLGDPAGLAIGSDGSLYIAEESNNRVRRVSPEGLISTVAGTGVAGFSGDGGPATNAAVTFPTRVAIGPDSSIYFTDGSSRVRRITPDGIVNTVAGNGSRDFSGDGGPAILAALNNPFGVAPTADGGFYIADDVNNRVRRVGQDGIIHTVADYSAQSGQPFGISLTRTGDLLISVRFASARTPQIDLLKTDGSLVTVAGGGPSAIQQGIPALQANLVSVGGVASAPDGSFFIAPADSDSLLYHVGPALPGFDGGEILIASADASQLFVFDANGRHLRTLNALTGATLFEFAYDAGGRLNQVTEKTGGTDNVTAIEHDAAGNPTAIVGPFGQRTTLSVDANGYLSAISNPAGEVFQMTSDPGGLLTSYSDPRGKTNVFRFDPEGRLLADTDATGATQSLLRTEEPNGFMVSHASPLGRATTYEVANFPGNIVQRTVTPPDGTQIQSAESIDAGMVHSTYSDGEISDVTLGPDPRFGMESPVVTNFSLLFPSSLRFVSSSTRSVVLTNTADPLSLVTVTSTATTGGNSITNSYDAATRTLVTHTAAGREHTAVLDDLGRCTQGQIGNLDPTLIAFDARGRLQSISRGSGPNTRSIAMAYNGSGFVDSITDSSGRAARFSYDAVGRITSKTLPDGNQVAFGYDVAGNLTSVTPAGRPAYELKYSDRGELISLTPPAVPGSAATTLVYDADLAVTNMTRAGFYNISIHYDTSGRPDSRVLKSNGGQSTTNKMNYDSAGRLSGISVVGGETVTLSYDGNLRTGMVLSGPVAGTVARTYDSSLRLASQSVNGANPISFNYEADGLLTGAGDLTVVRDSQNGLQTGTALGTITLTRLFNGVGEPTNVIVKAGVTTLYSSSVVRDTIGRITQKIETVGGVTDTFLYSYDLVGQLTNVTRNGSSFENYNYDVNGNRTGAITPAGAISASYDNQDRLVQYGSVAYTCNPAGDLAAKTNGAQATTFDYDAVGNLRGIVMPDGTSVSYVMDGFDRRVGRKVNGTLVQGWLYDDFLRPIAELDGTGAVVSRFVYASETAPAYLIKGGQEYQLIRDQVGSVRLVVNTASGAIVQQLDYDSFGNVLADTNPGFQPFGFAGGLYDPITKLVLFGVRDYDPQTGRWTRQNPAWFSGDDPNLYRYCANDPINLLDPMGLDNWDAAQGFFDQLNEEIQTAVNPVLGLNLLIDSAVNAGERALGFDPGPTMRDMMFHPGLLPNSPFHPDSRADYETGEIAGVCVGIAGQLAFGGLGDAAAAGRLARLSEEAEPLALHVDSTEEMLSQMKRLDKQARQDALNQMSKGLEQVLADQHGSANSGFKQ